MPKFVIEPHFRLHEWIADGKGYFTEEGLDYQFREHIRDRRPLVSTTRTRRYPIAASGGSIACAMRFVSTKNPASP